MTDGPDGPRVTEGCALLPARDRGPGGLDRRRGERGDRRARLLRSRRSRRPQSVACCHPTCWRGEPCCSRSRRPHRPATDLGYLLHKHPDRLHEAELSFGVAHVFFPGGDRGAVHGRGSRGTSTPSTWFEDTRGRRAGRARYEARRQRPGRMRRASAPVRRGERRLPHRRSPAGPRSARSSPTRRSSSRRGCRRCPSGGATTSSSAYFVPLGSELEASPIPLDEAFPEWGESRYVEVACATPCAS